MKLVTFNPQQVRANFTLRRQGAWLIADGVRWQMHSVEGPLEARLEGREIFHVTTASKQKLVVSRPTGERGMRELRLESILAADPDPLFVSRSA